MVGFRMDMSVHVVRCASTLLVARKDVSEVRSPLVVVVVILQIGRLRRHRAPVLRDGTLLAAQSEKIKASTSARRRFLFIPRCSLFFTLFFPALLFIFHTTTAPPSLPIHYQDNMDGWFLV